MSEKHCETCICGRRAPVQADSGTHRIDKRELSPKGAGTITCTSP